MSPDPYNGSYDLSNPQSLNRYSYVGNMPVGFTVAFDFRWHSVSGLIGVCGSVCADHQTVPSCFNDLDRNMVEVIHAENSFDLR